MIRNLLLVCTLVSAFTGFSSCQSPDVHSSADSDKTIILVRHAEKCLSQGSDPALTSLGLARAQDLARTLYFYDIERVYSTPYKRTIETARPTAEYFDLEIVETPITEDIIDEVADTILLDENKVILVVGHSDTTPQLVNQLAGTSMGNIDDLEYDHLFIITISDDEGPSLKRIRYGAPSGAVEECS